MKQLLIILATVISLQIFSQSVPDNETFSLQDVYNVVHSHAPSTTFDLLSCLANANSDYYDPSYNSDSYAVANSRLRFRNYAVNVKIRMTDIRDGGYNATTKEYVNIVTTNLNQPVLSGNHQYYLRFEVINPEGTARPMGFDYRVIEVSHSSTQENVSIVNNTANYITTYPYSTDSSVVTVIDNASNLFDAISDRISGFPETYNNWNIDIPNILQSNLTHFYVPFKATCYANFNSYTYKYIGWKFYSNDSLYITADDSSYVSNRTFTGRFNYEDKGDDMKFAYPNPVDRNGTLYIYGYSNAVKAKMFNSGGALKQTWTFTSNTTIALDLNGSYSGSGYFVRLYDSGDNVLSTPGGSAFFIVIL